MKKDWNYYYKNVSKNNTVKLHQVCNTTNGWVSGVRLYGLLPESSAVQAMHKHPESHDIVEEFSTRVC